MIWEKLKFFKSGQKVAVAPHDEMEQFFEQKKPATHFQKLRSVTMNHPKLSAAFIIGCITFAAAMLVTILILIGNRDGGGETGAGPADTTTTGQTTTEASMITAERLSDIEDSIPESSEDISVQVTIKCSVFNETDPGCGPNSDCYYYLTADVYTRGCRCHYVSVHQGFFDLENTLL